jgi:GntR family transcriptional regulator, N-acetylglucosamine utilization regulator
MLHANDPLPLYKQLYHQLHQAIENGEFEAGRRLPSERDLAANNGISRVTTRKAIDMLRQEGYVRAYQGKGCFVAHCGPKSYDVVPLEGFTAATIRRGMTPTSRLLSRGVVPASSDIADHLRIGEKDKTVRIRRLRLSNNRPIALDTAYLPYPLCEYLLDIDLERQSLYRTLETQLHIRLAYANQTVQTTLGRDNDLSLLGLRAPAAVFQLQRETYDSQGQVIEFVDAVYRGDTNATKFHPYRTEM